MPKDNPATQPPTTPLDVRPTPEQVKAAAQRLQALKSEYTAIQSHMARIQAEAVENWRILNQVVPHLDRYGRSPVQNPRPVEHKLIISAGRAIATALKDGKSLEQTRAAAILAATRTAKKYGLDSIPSPVLGRVESKTQERFENRA